MGEADADQEGSGRVRGRVHTVVKLEPTMASGIAMKMTPQTIARHVTCNGATQRCDQRRKGRPGREGVALEREARHRAPRVRARIRVAVPAVEVCCAQWCGQRRSRVAGSVGAPDGGEGDDHEPHAVAHRWEGLGAVARRVPRPLGQVLPDGRGGGSGWARRHTSTQLRARAHTERRRARGVTSK